MQSGCFGLASRRFFFICCCLQKLDEIFSIHPNTTLSPILPRRYLLNSLLTAARRICCNAAIISGNTCPLYAAIFSFLVQHNADTGNHRKPSVCLLLNILSTFLHICHSYSEILRDPRQHIVTPHNAASAVCSAPLNGCLCWFAGHKSTGETEVNIGPMDPPASCLSIKHSVCCTRCLEEFDGNWMCFVAL